MLYDKDWPKFREKLSDFRATAAGRGAEALPIDAIPLFLDIPATATMAELTAMGVQEVVLSVGEGRDGGAFRHEIDELSTRFIG